MHRFTLDVLVGSWRLWRTVFDRRTRKTSAMWGKALFSPGKKSELVYVEEVTHQQEDEKAYRAQQRYRYELKGNQLEMYRYDEAPKVPFLTLPIDKLRGKAHCGADKYELDWNFKGAELFLQRYSVLGPRKDYVIRSLFSR